MSCSFDALRLGDGHNRYETCTHQGFPLWTVDADHCHSREDALSWIAAEQIGRRNLTLSQKTALAEEIEKQLAVEAKKRRRKESSRMTKAAERVGKRFRIRNSGHGVLQGTEGAVISAIPTGTGGQIIAIDGEKPSEPVEEVWMIEIECDDALKTLISFDERDECLEEI